MTQPNRPSIPLMLFAIADAIGSGGLPEPETVYVDADNMPNVRLRTHADLNSWCDWLGIGTGDWDRRSQLYEEGEEPQILTNTYGQLRGFNINVHCCEPVAAAAAAGYLLPDRSPVAAAAERLAAIAQRTGHTVGCTCPDCEISVAAAKVPADLAPRHETASPHCDDCVQELYDARDGAR